MAGKWIVEVVEPFEAVIELGPLMVRDMTGKVVDMCVTGGAARTCVLPRRLGDRFTHKTMASALKHIATEPDKLRLIR